ncbi:MAG: hypothetical protein LUH22_11315 [Bacteroides sp.]|nr:hypothetical protein [Bacteroides sp.]
MRKIIFPLLCSLLCICSVVGQSNTEKQSAIHISFIPPLSTHGTQAGEYTNGVSINFLAGISKNEKYFTFGGLANIIKNNASGVQFAGLANVIGNRASGLQFAGLFNASRGANGLQFAGLANVTENLVGFQFAGLGNVVTKVTGIQFAGLGNVAENVIGFQFGGIGNIAGNVTGFQFGGIFNVARNVTGFQLGSILNIAENSDYPIGLVNIIKNGEKSIGFTYDDTGSILTSFRSGGRVLYGILGIGYNHKAEDEHYVVEGGFGAHIPIVERFRINVELKSQYMTSFSNSDVTKSGLSILPAYKLTSNLELFAGPSLNYMESDNIKNGDLFPGHNLWKKYSDTKLKQLFFGYTAGIQWIF